MHTYIWYSSFHPSVRVLPFSFFSDAVILSLFEAKCRATQPHSDTKNGTTSPLVLEVVHYNLKTRYYTSDEKRSKKYLQDSV